MIGMIAIAVSIYFGLSSLDIGKKLTKIAEKLTEIRRDSRKIGDIRSTIERMDERTEMIKDLVTGSSTETVEKELDNLGKTTITAEPHTDYTVYTLKASEGNFKAGFISKKSKDTNFHQKEIDLLGKPTRINVYGPRKMKIHVPTSDPETSTEFIKLFLEWLDSTYYEATEEIEEYEKI